jgi:dehydrogenase/reductase SDR family protein 7B
MKASHVFENRVIWLTGASSGIGEQVAYLLNEAGARLILSSRKTEKLRVVAAARPRPEVPVYLLPLDQEELDSLPVKADEAWAAFGHIDYLINMVGVSVRGKALETTREMDEFVMRVNYQGTVVLTKAILPRMLDRGFAHVVATSSLSGKYGVPQLSAYAASKHALHGFFESLRTELHDQGLRVTLLVPGMIRTHIIQNGFDGQGQPFDHAIRGIEEGYDVRKAARDMVRAIARKKQEVFIGSSWEHLTLWLQRISPRLQRWLLRSHPMRMLRKLKGKRVI